MRIAIKKLRPDALIPVYRHPGDSGFDFHIIEDTLVEPGQTALAHTGLAIAVPEGFELQIRMRSGAALNTPLIIPNAPATVDAGYRGELGIIVRNCGDTPYLIQKGERIAQGVIAPVIRAELVECDELPASERGTDAYGSTGRA